LSLFSILTKEDYLMIKWQIGFALVGLLLSAGIYLGVDYLSEGSLLDLRIAQSDFNNSRSRVELIEEEEATIIEYIERYQVLDSQGVMSNEDRLQIRELLAEIRADNNLFPVLLNTNEQSVQTLNYPPETREPGDPIALRSSVIRLEFPLLHEEDLTRLMNGILNSPGLFQTNKCEIRQQNETTTSFIIISRHFNAECEILWYTFDLNPPPPSPFGF
jgi:hypothetical protein